MAEKKLKTVKDPKLQFVSFIAEVCMMLGNIDNE